MTIAIESVITPRFVGVIELAGRHVEVFDSYSDVENLLWLDVRDRYTHTGLGLIRWDQVRSPRITLTDRALDWVTPGSRRAEDLVTATMSLHRSSHGLPSIPESITIRAAKAPVAAVLPLLTFDVLSTHEQSFVPRGIARVPRLRTGEPTT